MSQNPVCSAIGTLHHCQTDYRRCQTRFDAISQQIQRDLSQLAQGVAGNVGARDATICHCHQQHVPVSMLAAAFALDAATVEALVASTPLTGAPPLRLRSLVGDLANAQAAVVQLEGARERLALALFDLASLTLHTAIMRDKVIRHCYEQGVALPLIAKAFGESLAAIMRIIQP